MGGAVMWESVESEDLPFTIRDPSFSSSEHNVSIPRGRRESKSVFLNCGFDPMGRKPMSGLLPTKKES